MIPKRKSRPKMNVRMSNVIRCPQHLAFVRKHDCACLSTWCSPQIEAAHVRSSGDGGVGMKPGDNWTIPLCSDHHRLQHGIGEKAFEQEHGIDMRAIAKALWDLSPAGKKYRLSHLPHGSRG